MREVSRLVVPECRELPDRAAFEEVYRPPAGRHVRVNFVMSVDGAIEVDGTSGALGGEPDKDAFMAMRAVADVILVGAGTARAENYGPVRLDPAARGRRVDRGQPPLPPVAVVTASGTLAADSRLFSEATDGPRPIVVAPRRAAIDALVEVADVITCGDDEVDVVQAMAALADRGLRSVLCEGGPGLTAQLLVVGAADELCMTVAPQLAGSGRRTLAGIWTGDPTPLRLMSLIEGQGLLLARYAVAE